MFEMRVGDRVTTIKHPNDLVTRYVFDEHDKIAAKECAKCLKMIGIEKFSKNSANKFDGKQSGCKECANQYYKANKERIAERVKQYRTEKKKESSNVAE